MIFKDIKDLKNHKHISVVDEYNAFRNYYAEYTNEKYPVYKITYNPQENKKSEKYLIISGVHGNEPAPVYAVRDFIISLKIRQLKERTYNWILF